jgi:deoxyribonuclease V
VAGVDACFTEQEVVAVASLFSYPDLKPVRDSCAIEKIRFPYIPGLLTFREGPAVIEAIRKLRVMPDVVIVDGQGIAHPLGIGIASHIGVLLNLPSLGCAKSRLVGEYREPGAKKGDWSPLVHRGREAGAVLRTRDHVKPVFVSPGHLIDVRSSIRIVLDCLSVFRLPEPIRRADHLSRMLVRNMQGGV